MNSFRAGGFNVLVATDVAARGIDIQDVDLVIQFEPPRDVDTYVHRSGRTGRAGKNGTSVLLYSSREARDIVKIERGLGHGFKFELKGPPSIEAALGAAAKTSAVACQSIPESTSVHFKEAAKVLLEMAENPEDVVAKCLAAISRRASEVQSRSLLTGELGYATIEMSSKKGRPVTSGDVMFTVSKLSKMSRDAEGGNVFDNDVGKILSYPDKGTAVFDMGVSKPTIARFAAVFFSKLTQGVYLHEQVEDAKKLVEFSKNIEAGGAVFKHLKELEIERDHRFGVDRREFSGDRRRGGYKGSGGGYNKENFGGYGGRTGGGHRNNNYSPRTRSNYDGYQQRDDGAGGGSYRKRYDSGYGRGRNDGGGRVGGKRYDSGSGRRNNDDW